MKTSLLNMLFASIAVVGALVFTANETHAQNRISGYVFGVNRMPVSDLYVEVQDDLYRGLSRTRTNGAGYYSFSGLSSGRFTVHVFTYGTYYDEEDQSVEIQNTQSSGGRTTGFASEQLDFYLKLKKGVSIENVAVFAQDVPAEAKKLYDKALDDLDNKRTREGIAELKSALEIFPKYYYALERLGTEYVQLGSPEGWQAAEILLAMAVEINPRGYKSWYGLAYSRYSLGKFPTALTAAQKTVEINAYFPEGMFLAGSLLRTAKKSEESEKHLLKAKELSKDTIPAIHWELALLYGNNMKRYADAARELKLFLKAQPDAKDTEKIRKLITDFETKAAKV
jgi:tetratricopeptide (TPR) repeat protein